MDKTITKKIIGQSADGSNIYGGAGTLSDPVVNPNVITSENLNNQNPQYNLPAQAPLTQANGMNGFMESLITQGKTESQKRTESNSKIKEDSGVALESLYKNLFDTNNEIATAGSTIDRSKEDAAFAEYDRQTSNLEREQISNKRRIEEIQKNRSGALASGVAIESDRVNRESLSKQVDIAYLQSVASRDYSRLNAIGDRELALKLEPMKAKVENLKLFIDYNKDIFDKADERLYNEALKKEEAQLKKTENIETQIVDMKKNVSQFAGANAPSILNELSKIDTSKPGAIDAAFKIAGKYQTDPLDRAIKQETLNKLRNTNGGTPDAPTTKEINGKTMQWNGKEWIDPPTSTGTTSGDPVIVQKSLDEINTIKKLATDNVAIGASTGKFQYGNIPFSNRLQDWRAQAGNILAKLTVTELARIKGTGVTFGALSEGERLAVSAAASVLNEAKIFKGDGENKEWTGRFSISDTLVKQAFAEIQQYAELDFQKRNGMTTEQYTANTYLNGIDSALKTITSPYADYINK